MSEKLLHQLKKVNGEIVIMQTGEIYITIANEHHFVEKIDGWEQAQIFAKGIQVALSYFIGYRPKIKLAG